MGHGSDKLYITHREHAGEFGDHSASSAGAKVKQQVQFARLPFDCCALSLKPFDVPVCTPDGTTYDFLNIVPYIRKYGRDPVTGAPLAAKDLLKLNFFKNAEDNYYDPVTYKVFTEHTAIVAIKPSGNVFSKESIERLNVKPGNWRDLVTDEKFTRADIITLQDPHNPEPRNLAEFDHLKKNFRVTDEEAEAALKDPLGGVNLAATGGAVAAVLQKIAKSKAEAAPKPAAKPAPTKQPLVPEPPVASTSKAAASSSSRAPVPYNASAHSTGRSAASLTSTAFTPVTKTEHEMIDEEDFMFEQIKAKGYVRITTNMGDLNIELYCDRAPRTCYNFLMLARARYYDGTDWHRSIPGFMLQGGDPTGTGKGGESYWKKPFGDETHLRNAHKHEARGALSMANHGKDTNGSQFFITFRATPHLNGKHTVFGRVVGGESVLDKLEAVPVDPATDRPTRPLKIVNVSIFDDPFDKYKDRLSKKLQRERDDLDLEVTRRKAKEAREKDRLTWFGTKLDEKDAPKEDVLGGVEAGVGKYLGAANGAKRKEPAVEDGYGVGVKAQKKRKGFGDMSEW